MPKELLNLIPTLNFPSGGFAEVLLPKLLVFFVLWSIAAWQIAVSWWVRGFSVMGKTSPIRNPLLWLWLFVAASFVVSLLSPAPLGLNIPLLEPYESVLFRVLEDLWYLLTFATATLVGMRLVRLTWIFHLMALGACLAGLWALLESYGLDPMQSFDSEAKVGVLVQGTMGHQGYIAAYLAVVLVFWVTWRLLVRRVRRLDYLLILFLTICLVSTGGRAGILAAAATLLPLFVLRYLRSRSRVPLFPLCVLILVGVVLPLASSPHAQVRLGRLESAVQGEDPATSHRFIFWQLGLKGIRERPLTGYGIDAFGNVSWALATPEQAAEMQQEFVRPERARGARRLGNLVFFPKGKAGTLPIKAVKPYRVHNYLLDIAFASGIPVLLLFLGFLSSTAWVLYRARTPVSLATLLALVTYMVYGMVWFATPNVDTMVWGLVGVGLGSVWLEHQKRQESSEVGHLAI